MIETCDQYKLRKDMRRLRRLLIEIRQNPALEQLNVWQYMFFTGVFQLMDRYSREYREVKMKESQE